MTLTFPLEKPVVLRPMGISAEQLDNVRMWAMTEWPRFRPNRPWRQYGVLDELEAMGRPMPHRIELRAALLATVGLPESLPQEPLLGDFCGVVFHSGAVHKHRDQEVPGSRILRTNLMVWASPRGGAPVIEGEELLVTRGMAWAFHPDRMTHWTTQVEIGPRVVVSFGHLVEEN